MGAEQPRFVPEEWDEVYERSGQTAESLVFSRTSDLVVQTCAELLPQGCRIADVGCGSGRVSSRLASLGLGVLALDRDPAMIRFARRRVAPASDAARVSFTVADASALPLTDGACDAVAAVSLIGCLPDLRHFLVEVHRVLRPGGVAILTLTNRRSLLLRTDATLKRFRRPRGARRDSLSYNVYRHADVTRLLAELGFTVTRSRFFNLFLPLGRWTFPPRRVAIGMERLVGGAVADYLALNFLIVAERRTF